MRRLVTYILEKLQINKDYINPYSSNDLIKFILNAEVFKHNSWYKSKNEGYYSFKPVETLTRMISSINHYPTRNEHNIRNSKINEVQHIINVLDKYEKNKLFEAAKNCKEYAFLTHMELPYGSKITPIISELYDHTDMDKKSKLTINFGFKRIMDRISLKVCTNGDYVVFILFRITEKNEEDFRAFYICKLK